VQRRERTRHLIELGGLVQKAGLVELPTTIAPPSTARCSIWSARRGMTMPATRCALEATRGKRAFDAEAEGATEA
jgi:hypothetical protein